jgi:hypothetical protein
MKHEFPNISRGERHPQFHDPGRARVAGLNIAVQQQHPQFHAAGKGRRRRMQIPRLIHLVDARIEPVAGGIARCPGEPGRGAGGVGFIRSMSADRNQLSFTIPNIIPTDLETGGARAQGRSACLRKKVKTIVACSKLIVRTGRIAATVTDKFSLEWDCLRLVTEGRPGLCPGPAGQGPDPST